MMDYRISSCNSNWYVDLYSNFFERVKDFNPYHPQEVDLLPQGVLAEFFFMDACKQNGIECNPCIGDDDVMGIDFGISKYNETRFVDVSLNVSRSSISRKTKEWRVATLFLPWRVQREGEHYKSYAHQYLDSGYFDGYTFLNMIISANYVLLDGLKRNVWRGENVVREILRRQYSDFSGSGIQYVRSLDGVLLLLRRSLN